MALSKKMLQLLDFALNHAPVCSECGATMYFKKDPNNEGDLVICPNCGYEENEYTYNAPEKNDYDVYYGGDTMDEDDIPEGCEACGGPYPECCASCNLFDD